MKELQVKIRAIPCDFEPPYSTEICQGYANGWQSALNAVVKFLEGEGWYCTRCFGGPCDPHCPEALSRKLVVAAIGDSAIRTALAALEMAADDMREWRQLARRQYDEMPHNAALCPTALGINTSEGRSEHVARAIRLLREVLSTSSDEVEETPTPSGP